ncbi:MAG TPA: hypothetical protein VMI06_04430 [Terriglobia bacterium]|nr:hypothetical protein [Terriglobia bacterium]
MKTALAWLLPLLFCVGASAQKNAVEIFAVGNFNPSTYIFLGYKTANPLPTFSSDKSAMGGGADYQFWFKPHVAAGLEYEQNPSDGHLVSETLPVSAFRHYTWPEMRYELLALTTQQADIGRFSLFIQEGVGSVVTNGYSNSGWSHDFAIATGYGLRFHTTKRTSLFAGERILDSKQGCYEDHTCLQTWGTTQDLHAGLTFLW